MQRDTYRGDGLAEVAHKVGHREELRGLLVVGLVFDTEVPVVRELELEARVVRRLHGDDVRAEVGPEQQAQALDRIGHFWLAARKREQRELLVRVEHHQVRTEHDARLLRLVVVHLDGRYTRMQKGTCFLCT